jgi:hypothetical protein
VIELCHSTKEVIWHDHWGFRFWKLLPNCHRASIKFSSQWEGLFSRKEKWQRASTHKNHHHSNSGEGNQLQESQNKLGIPATVKHKIYSFCFGFTMWSDGIRKGKQGVQLRAIWDSVFSHFMTVRGWAFHYDRWIFLDCLIWCKSRRCAHGGQKTFVF